MNKDRLRKWTWLCPLLGVAMAAAVLVLWGVLWWTALLAAFMLVCPITILWGLITLGRDPHLKAGTKPDSLCCHNADEKGDHHD